METRPHSLTLNKNQFKIDWRFGTENLTQYRKTEKTPESIAISKDFLNKTPIFQETRPRIDIWGCIKENNCDNGDTIYRVGENSCHVFFGQGINIHDI
jgi:hypothetical protein